MIEVNTAQPIGWFHERRRTPRIEILGQLYGEIVSVRTPITVREIGLGGFSVDTALALPVGAVHAFRLTPTEGAPVIVRARVVYSRAHEPAQDGTGYTSGLQFVDDSGHHSRRSVASLIDQVTSVLSFDGA
jgi:PilZ domain